MIIEVKRELITEEDKRFTNALICASILDIIKTIEVGCFIYYEVFSSKHDIQNVNQD